MHQGKFVFAQVQIDHIPRCEFLLAVDKYFFFFSFLTFKLLVSISVFDIWPTHPSRKFAADTESLLDFECPSKQIVSHGHQGYSCSFYYYQRPHEVSDRVAHLCRYSFDYLIRAEPPASYTDDIDFSLELDNAVYALDATTIPMCLTVLTWAEFRKNKGAIKLHTLMDMRGSIPVFLLHISDGLNIGLINVLDYFGL